jgi:hypothetical protein
METERRKKLEQLSHRALHGLRADDIARAGGRKGRAATGGHANAFQPLVNTRR